MRIIIESYLIFILLIFISFTSIEYIGMNKDISTARSFHTACIDSIENSGFNQEIISKWEENAEKFGYQLKISDESSVKAAETIPCYFVSLTYNIRLNLLGINEASTIKGYAR